MWPFLFIPYFWWDDRLELTINRYYKGDLDDLHHNPCVPVLVDAWHASHWALLQEHHQSLWNSGVMLEICLGSLLLHCLDIGSSEKYLGV